MSSPPTGSSESRHEGGRARHLRRIAGPGVLLGFPALLLLAALAGVVQADPPRERERLGVGSAPGLGALAVAPANAAAKAAPPAPQRRVVEGVIQRGRTLSSLLRAQGVTPQVINQIAKGLKGHYDFRHAKPGQQFRLVLDGEGSLVEFRYRVSVTDGYTLRREGERFAVTRDEAQLEARPTRVAGIVTSTLYQSITNLGEEGSLAQDFADLFAWDVDFQRAVQPGDSYQILYERLYRSVGARDSYVRPGRILAARFQGRAGDHTAIYFQNGDARGGYYRPNGTSVEGEFLMAPLRHGRITSSYSSARRHPILKVTRPHRGIDYAASIGTPVWAVADGVVIHRGWSGGNGNLVQVKHHNGYVSSYAHLSRYVEGLKVGDRVDQKQVIGYVGQTGLATGPHVCFRIQKDGKYVDPSGLRMPSGPPIAGDLVPAFRTHRDQLLAQLEGQRRVAGY